MKMKRVIAAFLLAVIVIGGISVDKVQAENDEKTFIIGFDAEFPPYGYKNDNGEYVGFDLDLAAEVCERRGWTLIKRPIDWDSKDMELSSGMIDCISNGFTMNGRESEYTWSVPYVDNSQVVVVKKDSGIKELTDLADKIVVVQADSSALAAFTGEDATKENVALLNSFEELQQVGDYNSAFMNLESGMVDAVCMDIGVAKYRVESRGDEFVLLDEQISTEAYGIGFKLGNTELRDKVNATLKEMQEDGTFDLIAKEWGLTDCVCIQSSFEKLEEDSDVSIESGENTEEKADDKKVDIMSVVKQLGQGMLATFGIFALTLLFSLPLGLLITFIRMSKIKPLQWLAKLYISIMRGTPLMLQLLVVFFAPYYLFRADMSHTYRFYAVIIGFSLNYAAYFAEIYRAGIQSIPADRKKQQWFSDTVRHRHFVKLFSLRW